MAIISGHNATTTKLMQPATDYLLAGAPGNGTTQVETLEVIGSPTGGTFKLAFEGQTTDALAHNANATAIQTALRALPTIGSAGVTVSGTNPYTVTFAAHKARTALGRITLAENALTGGTAPTVDITLTTPGVTANPYKPLAAAKLRRLDTNAVLNNAGTADEPNWTALT